MKRKQKNHRFRDTMIGISVIGTYLTSILTKVQAAAPITSDGTMDNFVQTVANFIAMLQIPAYIVLAVVLVASGYLLVTGDEQQQEKVKKGLVWKIVGFCLIVGALTWASIVSNASAF